MNERDAFLLSRDSLINLLSRLWEQLAGRRRRQIAALLVLMVAASLAEVLSLGAILPFLGVLTAPDRVASHPIGVWLIRSLGIESTPVLVLTLALGFGATALLAGGIRLLLLWSTTRVIFKVGAELSDRIFERTLYQTYTVHVSRNSSEVISGVTIKANELIYSGLLPVLNIMSSGILIAAILGALFTIDPVTAIGSLGGFGLVYGFVVLLTRRRLMANSQRTASAAGALIKILQESLGGIRDILLDGTQRTFLDLYRQTDQGLRKSQGSSYFIGASPRIAIEAVGMLVIALVAYWLYVQPGGAGAEIPVLGAFALGAQRMLPAVQQVYAGWATLQGGRASLRDGLSLLEQPLERLTIDLGVKAPMRFQHVLELREVSLAYEQEGALALDNVSLQIHKGERIGFVGATGSGKSSMMDVIMGLMPPTSGGLYVDGLHVSFADLRDWQARVAHVPQSIFLADMSVAENIAFGVHCEKIDIQRVRAAARQAHIAELIESWPQQYDTLVGERGVRISGGQRQRVGIARALYKQADVIIFDEATSALDDDTERSVMSAIDGLRKDFTILMVAHRISTLRKCDRIVKLNGGKITHDLSYQELLTASAIDTERSPQND